MKKGIITIIALLLVSSCSFISDRKIEEGEKIEIENFVETQSKDKSSSGNIEDQEVQKTEEEIEKLIELLLE